ncbi:nitroreductase family protein [Candidatus Nitrosoglobus terrae]|uniref:Nitroreductase family protein n=1 Tax=Candidatus Nitrosoglobus terrae TaxID=1630141 RepID=A0A1Q2SNA8_9GAMM|nr:hypothetical protein [Candidatus Nitrosoglobus terrae]BAW80602.1 nitroreductase family protein [Candidatus Nitrosoglobus terrae]
MIPELIKYLASAGQSAPSADNSQPWEFVLSEQSIELFIDLKKIKPSCFDIYHPAILLAIGAVIENILQAANWISVKIDYSDCLCSETGKCAVFYLAGMPTGLPENARAHPLFTRCTNRLPFIKKALPDRVVHEMLSFSNATCQVLLFQKKEQLNQWSEWIRAASEVRFQTPSVHEWFGQSLKFTPREVSANEGLDVNTLGLPFGGKYFLRIIRSWARMRVLNKFGAYKLIAKMEVANIKNSSALVGLIAPLDTESAIKTGQLMEKIWIRLNELGLSIQPIFVVSDQLYRLREKQIPPVLSQQLTDLKSQLQSELNITDSFLYMLLRIGYCETEPVRSMRRSIK